jgi:hypothetical protein
MCESAALLLLLWTADPAANADGTAAAAEPAVAACAALVFASASATSRVAVRFAAQKVKKYREPAAQRHKHAADMQVLWSGLKVSFSTLW